MQQAPSPRLPSSGSCKPTAPVDKVVAGCGALEHTRVVGQGGGWEAESVAVAVGISESSQNGRRIRLLVTLGLGPSVYLSKVSVQIFCSSLKLGCFLVEFIQFFVYFG